MQRPPVRRLPTPTCAYNMSFHPRCDRTGRSSSRLKFGRASRVPRCDPSAGRPAVAYTTRAPTRLPSTLAEESKKRIQHPIFTTTVPTKRRQRQILIIVHIHGNNRRAMIAVGDLPSAAPSTVGPARLLARGE
mmetsp:Transcript_19263/g.58064  ORF Transcript_19263/g.58064 Transcript_19263/m.58064 type:complete len:133 (-) Transcript_19263:1051-1449(-)